MQATSSFLLWAQAASDCGATLTRECVLENLRDIHVVDRRWPARRDRPGWQPPAVVQHGAEAGGQPYVRVAPTEPASYECDPSWVGTVTGVPALGPLNLDADRHPQAGG